MFHIADFPCCCSDYDMHLFPKGIDSLGNMYCSGSVYKQICFLLPRAFYFLFRVYGLSLYCSSDSECLYFPLSKSINIFIRKFSIGYL